MERFHLQLEPEVLVVDFDRLRVLAGAVQDAGNLRLAAQAAARTRALNAPRFGFDLDLHVHSRLVQRPATRTLRCCITPQTESSPNSPRKSCASSPRAAPPRSP